MDRKLMRFDALDDDFEELSDALDKLGEDGAKFMEGESVEGSKMSEEERKTNLKQHLYSAGVSRRGIAMAEAGYANTLGASLEHLSLGLTRRIEYLWDNDGGDVDFRIVPSTRLLLERLQRGLDAEHGVEIKKGCPVFKIELQGSSEADASALVQVEYFEGGEARTVKARHVVVSVPVPILQGRIEGESINFVPQLPEDKRAAIDTLGVRGAMKVVARFSEKFWPEDMHGTVCSDSHIPEFWAHGAGALVDADSKPIEGEQAAAAASAEPCHILVGFAMAGAAANLATFKESQILDMFVQQLDVIFGDKKASSSFLHGFVLDWSQEAYIRGGYSFPSIHEHTSSRGIVARSEFNGRLHFCGEATDATESYMTMHSAMRTGIRAANEIL